MDHHQQHHDQHDMHSNHSKHFHMDIDKHAHSDHTITFGGCIGKSICIDGSIKHSTQTHGELSIVKSSFVHNPTSSFVHTQHTNVVSLSSPQLPHSHHITL